MRLLDVTVKQINEPVSDLLLERYSLGELTRGEGARIRHRLRLDEILRSRLSALERSNVEILEWYPPKDMAALIRKKLSNGQSARRRRSSAESPSNGARGGRPEIRAT